MRNKKLTAHSSPTTIRSNVCEYGESAEVSATEELKKYKNSGKRFVLLFDEWTGKNIRYLTIKRSRIQCRLINLGMVRVWSSQKAETILELVTKKIKDFGLAIDDIVAFVTDGASIMMKLGG